MTVVLKKDIFCISCEVQFLTKEDEFGPVCRNCFQRTKRKDPLMQAALQKTLVAVIPMVCPHEERRHHCRTRFSVLVLDKKLDPVEITGPYSLRDAEKRANRIRKQVDRRKQ